MSTPISNAEWRVMRVLWAGAPMSAQSVIDALGDSVVWKPKTVKTLLGRLVKKQVVRAVPAGREHMYSPQVDEDDCKLEEARSFLDRVFDGSVAPLVAHLAEGGELSTDDIAALRAVLDEASPPKRRR